VDLPVSIEIVTVDRLGVETMSLEIGYGIGVVPNCDGTYVRHASGYEAYEGFSPTDKLPNWRSAPIIPPYDSFEDYMRFSVGKNIGWTHRGLMLKCREKSIDLLHVSSFIVGEARKWREDSRAPKLKVREFWHHPLLTKAKCGDAIPDHVEAKKKVLKKRKGDKIKEKAKKKRRLLDIVREMEWTRFWRDAEDRAHHESLKAEYNKLTYGAWFLQMWMPLISFCSNFF
jgi:hypothetical protein